MSVLALIPARSGSKGIPNKNLRTLGGKTLIQHAVDCARAAGIERVCVSTDIGGLDPYELGADILHRPAELASDTAPMIDVVRHFLSEAALLYTATLPAWTGKPVAQTLAEQIIVLLQPTQPLRRPEHVQQAIALLQESGADSVVSVVPLPLTHSPDWQCRITEWTSGPQANVLTPFFAERYAGAWKALHARRQDCEQTYIRDGTVYAFWRKTVEQHGTLYGQDVRPLIIDPADSCELDTEQDWMDLERRWKERHGG